MLLAILFASLSFQSRAAAVLTHRVHPRHPQLARLLKDRGPVGYTVCGSDDLVTTSSRFPQMFHPGKIGPGYLVEKMPTREKYYELAKTATLVGEDIRPRLRNFFSQVEILAVPRDFSAVSVSGRPLSVELTLPQAFGECLLQGPRGFSCGLEVDKKACCEGIFKMVGIRLHFKEFELDFRPGSGTLIWPKGHNTKAELRYCILDELAYF